MKPMPHVRKLHKLLNRKRLILLISLVPFCIIGIFVKLYMGRYSLVWPDKIAGTFYVIFWSFFIALIFPDKPRLKLVLVVFIITCLLEFTQLYSFAVLDAIRSTFVGRAMIGTSFSWSDFPWYLIGALLAYSMLQLLNRAYPGE